MKKYRILNIQINGESNFVIQQRFLFIWFNSYKDLFFKTEFSAETYLLLKNNSPKYNKTLLYEIVQNKNNYIL